jgi:hypothetical protein
VGQTTEAFEKMREDLAASGRSLEFVINEDYTERVRELVEHARGKHERDERACLSNAADHDSPTGWEHPAVGVCWSTGV